MTSAPDSVAGDFAFDAATAVDDAGDGHFTAMIHDGWDIHGNANGGYLLAVAGRAMLRHSSRRDPFTVTAHYLAPGPVGPVGIDVVTVKAGKLVTTSTASMYTASGDGASREIIRVLGACGEMPDAEVQHLVATPPELPPFDECVLRAGGNVESQVALTDRLDARIHPDDTAFMRGETIDDARVRAWFAFADHRPIDTLALLLAADAFPPPVFNIPFNRGWVPTLEFTVHVRARPVGTRLACVFRTRVAQGGLLESDGELWDEAGQLVALSRQMAVAPRA